ncbi:MAG: dihydropteroate synthase [Candidatus Kariarchaeaceae archaeon]
MTLIMGILNVTPDSFSDGGKYDNVEMAVSRAKEMIAEGADIIDVGGESTKPGSEPVSVEEELQRVVPVVERLLREEIKVSIDTMKPEVARKCLALGVHYLNDVTGLRNDEMLKVAVEFKVPVIIMHMQGIPKVMQENPSYSEVVEDVKNYLLEQAERAKKAGVSEIILDPGIGFGKTVEDNLKIIKNLDKFVSLGYPVLIGLSRKSFIGKITGLDVDERVEGTIAANTIAIFQGVSIIRVHDVKEAKRALLVGDAIKEV